MLPTDPPKISGRDFDPSELANNGEDVDMENDQEEDEGGSAVELSSVEINILIYLYLLESNFPHTAFTLLSESSLPSTSLFQHFHPSFPTPSSLSRPKGSSAKVPNASGSGVSPTSPTFGMVDGRIPRGELIRKLWKGVRWEEVERHVNKNGEPFKPACPSPFHLLIPHVCPSSYPSSSQNPALPLPSAMRISPSPRRTDPFPPPPENEAGPSRPRSSRANEVQTDKERLGVNDGAGKKRRSRRNSEEEGDSPARASKEKEGGKEIGGLRKGDKEKKKGRLSGEAMGGGRDKGKEKDMEVDNESSIPKIRVRNGSTAVNTPGKEDTPPTVEKKRKRDKDVNGELRPPTSGSGGSGDRRSKSPASASVSANTTPAVKTRDLPSEKRDRTRDKEKPVVDRSNGNPLWISDNLIGLFPGHRDSITCVEWNPSNPSVLASGSADGFARLWELDPSSSSSSSSSSGPTALTSRHPPKTAKHTSIESSLKKVTAMSWHPEGTILATASADGVGRLFTPDGQLQGIMSYGRGQVNAIKFSPDGRSVLTAKNDFVVSLWTVGKGYSQMMNRSYDAHTKEVNDVDWLDDNVFATAGNDQTIFIFHTSDKHIRYTLKGHTDDVTRIKWSPPLPDTPAENRLLASVSDDGFVLIWKLPNYPAERGRMGSRSASPSKTASTPGIPPVPTGKEDDDYFEKQGKKGREGIEYCIARLCVVSAENKRLNTLEWSPACTEGRMLLAAGGQDSSIKVFDVTTSTLLHEFTLESGTASLAFSPLGVPGYPLGAIAGGGWAGQLGIWDIETGEKKGDWEVDNAGAKAGPGILAMSWREDGQQLALGLQNRTVVTVATDLKGMANKASKAIKGEKIENA